MPPIVAPSALAADFGNLQKEIEMINMSDSDWLHIDIMDGLFVPNISYGPDIVKVMNMHSTKPLDVHLMIIDPDRYIETFREVGAEYITVHLEACNHLHRTIQHIHGTGAKAGVAINPHTSVSMLENVLEQADLFLVMSVNPGFGGQKFIYQTIEKVRKLKEMLIVKNSSALIEVDGGVGLQNAEALVNAGADILVAGSSVFKAENPHEVVTKLKSFDRNTFVG
jgi:ribulose-phosphate 3-epimerase